MHTAASGTGPDRAAFTDLFTRIRARGVGFQPGVCEVKLITVEEQLTPFKLLQNVALEPALVDKDKYAVVLNGFDLYADGDAQKLMTLVLEMTDPELDDSGTTLSFDTIGAFRVDCSSPECDGIIRRRRDERGRTWETSVVALQHQIVDDLQDPKRVMAYTAGEMQVIDGRVPSRNDPVSYILRVHYAIIAGDDEDIHIAHTAPVSHSYAWDRRTELPSTLADRESIIVPPVQGKPGFGEATFAFKQIVTTLYRGGLQETVFWRKDIAMHLLEWNLALRDIKVRRDRFSCALDLFFRNWYKWMRWSRLPFSPFAYRDAGEAQFGAQLTLLQFRDADILQHESHDGTIDWPGWGRKATDDPVAVHKHPLRIP